MRSFSPHPMGNYIRVSQHDGAELVDEEQLGDRPRLFQGKQRLPQSTLVIFMIALLSLLVIEGVHRKQQVSVVDAPDVSPVSSMYRSQNETDSLHTKSGASSWTDDQVSSSFPFGAEPPAFLTILYGSGLCSQLLNLFKTAIYLEETEGRNIMAMDTLYGRYERGSLGVLRGWFDPHFPVIDTPEKLAVIQPYTKNFTFAYVKHENDLRHCKDWTDGDVRITCLYDYGQTIRSYYGLRKDSTPFYRPLVDKMCPHLQFNAQASQAMTAFREKLNVPSFDDTSGTTVTFHVRRTDKLIKESRLYKGEEYVSRLVEVAPGVKFDHCFVATDSHGAVPEIEQALRKHNISCQVHYFARTTIVAKADSLQFFTELSYMINATYFVGTFNSNVGGMVGVLRACAGDKPLETFANSYGVDADEWTLR